MRRTIHAPDQELLKIKEVADWLTLSETTIRDLIDKGKFPQGIKIAPKATRWPWMDVVAYAHLAGRMNQQEAPGDDVGEEDD